MSDTKPKSKLPPFYFSYVSQHSNPKVSALTDAEFRAWHYALASARMSVPAGRWRSRDYLAADLGRKYAKHIDRLIELDLLRVDDDGEVLSANWDDNQPGLSDPTNADRQRRWREREREKREAAKKAAQPPADTPVGVTRYGVTDNTYTKLDDTSRVDKTRLDARQGDTNSSVEYLATVAGAPYGAPLPRDDWTPTRCIRCGVVIVDRDEAYEGDGPDATVHLGDCPL